MTCRIPKLPTTATIARSASALLLCALAVPAGFADEGMWTLDNFPKQAVRSKYGFEPTDAWLEQVRLSSARLAGGCSASFVSGSGLVMTNYHCVTGCVEELTTEQENLTRDGFYAPDAAAERKCSRIEVNQLLATTDVTGKVQGATQGLDGEAFVKAQAAQMGTLEKECTEDGAYRCDVVSLYHGGQYHLYKYRVYRDVRLVFAPEFEVGFFGGDPDNFNFPRYNLDLSFLRVYEDGKPARTDKHFTWSRGGAKEGEAVFVSGHPGATQRLLTVAQLEYLRDVAIPATMMRSSELRGLLMQFGKLGARERQLANDELIYLDNGLKVYRGRFEALTSKAAFEARRSAEQALRARIDADPARRNLYGGAWEAIEKAQEAKRRLRVAYSQLEQAQAFRSDLFTNARTIVRAAAELPKQGADRLREFRDSALPSLQQRLFSPAPIHKDLEIVQLGWSLLKLREELGADHPIVKKILGAESPDEMAARLVNGTKLEDVAERRRLWDGGATAVAASNDPMIRLAVLVDEDARAVRRTWDEEIDSVETKHAERIAKAFFEDRGTGTYPDATFTLRVTYGAVRGFPNLGAMVHPFTDFEGLYARVTGREPYALPKRWLDAKGRLKLDTRFNFIADTDIIGGNSGSPIVNRNAEIVGLAFDGNIHSLGGAYWFDESLNRTVGVHSDGILEALRSVYGADRIVRELAGTTASGR